MVTTHSQALSGLIASTLYHYRVKSKDAAGNLATSNDFSFTTTAPPDTTPPLISDVMSSNITTTGAMITWATDEKSDSQVTYGLTTTYGNISPLNSTLTLSHSITLNSLAAGVLIHFQVMSKDAAGNLATSADFTFTTLPVTTDQLPTVATAASANPNPASRPKRPRCRFSALTTAVNLS